jgi:hypothetical protein
MGMTVLLVKIDHDHKGDGDKSWFVLLTGDGAAVDDADGAADLLGDLGREPLPQRRVHLLQTAKIVTTGKGRLPSPRLSRLFSSG